MKIVTVLITVVCLAAGMPSPVWAAAQQTATPRAITAPQDTAKTTKMKGAQVTPQPFRVQSVQFQEVTQSGIPRLAVAVFFNKEIDPATVQPNVNIRLLRKNEQHFWVDAASQGNHVNVRPNYITWLSGAPLESAVYIMHLRGTIKSKDGLYLDCNGDGQGEGGNLPAYESPMYNAVVRLLDPLERD